MSERNYVVEFEGKPRYRLNESLALRQGVTDEELDKIRALHELKLKVFQMMEETDNVDRLRACAEMVTDIEFALQRNWHFPEDKRFHEWYKVPKCACPKMDNAERRGTSFQITVSDCPIHGF